MAQRLHGLVALASATLLMACVNPTSTPVPAGAQRMNASEIGALFEHPIQLDSAVHGGLTYRFTPGGELAVQMRLLVLRWKGGWRVANDGLCLWLQGDRWSCGALYRLGGGRYYFDLPHQGQDYNTLTVRP
ncbi:MAG: hypothetical protein RLZZ341_1992 [Pseudomonadota bacterium]|jgi:hypothetical protein